MGIFALVEDRGKVITTRSRCALAIAVLLILVLSFGLWMPQVLVLDNAAISDVILVLDGHDGNYDMGLHLLKKGMGRQMLVCLDLPDVQLTGTELLENRSFINRTAGSFAERIDQCRNSEGGTYSEVATRLSQMEVRSVLVVAPAGESRVLYESVRRAFPQYQFTVKASPDPSFDVRWWKCRLWTKTFLSSVSGLSAALDTKPLPITSSQRPPDEGMNEQVQQPRQLELNTTSADIAEPAYEPSK
jgi:hypothetical protein